MVDRAEQIKWWDCIDALAALTDDTEAWLQSVRECRHPDAQWLAGLFPARGGVSCVRMREVLLEQGEDPRAMHAA
jgi:hypothetical protein